MQSRSWSPWPGVVTVFGLAAVIAALPGFVLALSWYAIGFETGWWTGDSNMNDGEGVLFLVVGLVMLGVDVAGAALVASRCLRASDVQRPRRVVATGSALVLAAATVSAIVFIVA